MLARGVVTPWSQTPRNSRVQGITVRPRGFAFALVKHLCVIQRHRPERLVPEFKSHPGHENLCIAGWCLSQLRIPASPIGLSARSHGIAGRLADLIDPHDRAAGKRAPDQDAAASSSG